MNVAAVTQRLEQLLGEARAALDKVRQQQRETGEFREEDRLELVAKLAHLEGFNDALDVTGFKKMPSALLPDRLVEEWSSIQEDARDVRYVSWRPR